MVRPTFVVSLPLKPKKRLTLSLDTKTRLSSSSVLLQSFHLGFCVRELCLHDVWRPVPTHLVHIHQLHLHHCPYLTPAGSGPAQAWGWVCRAGRVVGLTWFCAGGCAYTGSRASLRDQRSLSLAPSELKAISLVWPCAQIEGWRDALRSPHSGTTHTHTTQRMGQKIRAVKY